MTFIINCLLLLSCWINGKLIISQEEFRPVIAEKNIGGWQLKEIDYYNSRQLFEYINGAADLYLSYDCVELQVYNYTHDRLEMVIEIYKFGNSTNAFGIYSRERTTKANYIEIGCQGYLDYPMLIFLHSRYYVKINTYGIAVNNIKKIQDFADHVSNYLGQPGELPEILSFFPLESRVSKSEKYFSHDFLGYAIFRNGYIVEYELNHHIVRLFIMEYKNTSESNTVLMHYVSVNSSYTQMRNPTIWHISDQNLGQVLITVKDRFIIGTLSRIDPALQTALINKILEKI